MNWITIVLTVTLDHPNLDLTDLSGTILRALQSAGYVTNGVTAKTVDGANQVAAHFQVPSTMSNDEAVAVLTDLIVGLSLPLSTPATITNTKVFPAAAPPIPGK